MGLFSVKNLTLMAFSQMQTKKVFRFKEGLFLFFLLLGAVYCFTSYSQFSNAAFTFDDDRVFKYLNSIDTPKNAWEFVKDAKQISPTGRPIAQASFLLNIGDYPGSPAGFRRINTLLHILNAFILALVCIKIARIVPPLTQNTTGFAVTLALTWLLHPFLASSSFHAIQRMTLLSGTFSLLCFLVYLHGRNLFPDKPQRALLWMSLGLIIFGSAGILAKENAALTPLLIAILELTILGYYKPINNPLFRHWKLLFFAGPTLLLALYTIYYLSYNAVDGYFLRPYTMTDRLFSESVILYDYLRQILIPDIAKMGPYQDDTIYIRGAGTITGLASLSWIVLISTAWHFRHKFPVYAFAILFYVTGHLLESTFISLELYFEHRNYLPSLGILGVLIGFVSSSKVKWPKILVSLYILLLAGLLWSLNGTWGHPILGPLAWAEAHPTSTRATQVLTTTLWRLGDVDKARETIISAYHRNPDDASLATGALIYQCFSNQVTESDTIINRIINHAPTMQYSRTISTPLFSAYTLISKGSCKSLKSRQAIRFLQGLLSNPLFINQDQRFAFNLLISKFAELDSDQVLEVAARSRAYRIRPWSNGAPSIYCKFISLNLPNEANNFLESLTKGWKGQSLKPEDIHCTKSLGLENVKDVLYAN